MKRYNKNYDITLRWWLILISFLSLFILGMIFSVHRLIYQDWEKGWNFIVGLTLFFSFFIFLIIVMLLLEKLFPKSKIAKKISKVIEKILELISNIGDIPIA
jgi:hypothetical protein